MKIDKNGRFFSNKKIEIIIPPLGTYLKYIIMMLIFLKYVSNIFLLYIVIYQWNYYQSRPINKVYNSY